MHIPTNSPRRVFMKELFDSTKSKFESAASQMQAKKTTNKIPKLKVDIDLMKSIFETKNEDLKNYCSLPTSGMMNLSKRRVSREDETPILASRNCSWEESSPEVSKDDFLKAPKSRKNSTSTKVTELVNLFDTEFKISQARNDENQASSSSQKLFLHGSDLQESSPKVEPNNFKASFSAVKNGYESSPLLNSLNNSSFHSQNKFRTFPSLSFAHHHHHHHSGSSGESQNSGNKVDKLKALFDSPSSPKKLFNLKSEVSSQSQSNYVNVESSASLLDLNLMKFEDVSKDETEPKCKVTNDYDEVNYVNMENITKEDNSQTDPKGEDNNDVDEVNYVNMENISKEEKIQTNPKGEANNDVDEVNYVNMENIGKEDKKQTDPKGEANNDDGEVNYVNMQNFSKEGKNQPDPKLSFVSKVKSGQKDDKERKDNELSKERNYVNLETLNNDQVILHSCPSSGSPKILRDLQEERTNVDHEKLCFRKNSCPKFGTDNPDGVSRSREPLCPGSSDDLFRPLEFPMSLSHLTGQSYEESRGPAVRPKSRKIRHKVARRRSSNRRTSRPVPRPRTRAPSTHVYANVPREEPSLDDVVPLFDRPFKKSFEETKTDDEWVDFSDIEVPLVPPYAVSPTLPNLSHLGSSFTLASATSPSGPDHPPYSYDHLATFHPKYIGTRGVLKGHSEPNLLKNRDLALNHHYERLNSSSSASSITARQNLRLDLPSPLEPPLPSQPPPPPASSRTPATSPSSPHFQKRRQSTSSRSPLSSPQDMSASINSMLTIPLSLLSASTRTLPSSSSTFVTAPFCSSTSTQATPSTPGDVFTPEPEAFPAERPLEQVPQQHRTSSVAIQTNPESEHDRDVGCFERSTLTSSRKSLRRLLRGKTSKKCAKETAIFYAELSSFDLKEAGFHQTPSGYEPLKTAAIYSFDDYESSLDDDDGYEIPNHLLSLSSPSRLPKDEGNFDSKGNGIPIPPPPSHPSFKEDPAISALPRCCTDKATPALQEDDPEPTYITPDDTGGPPLSHTLDPPRLPATAVTNHNYVELDDHQSDRWKGEVSLVDEIAQCLDSGKRAHWCDLAEVQRSGILNFISAQELKLQEAIFRVYLAQVRHVRTLELLVDRFVDCPCLRAALSPTQHALLFSDLLALRDINKKLLSELEARWDWKILLPDLGDILHQHATLHSPLYVKYCTNQRYQQTTLTKLRKEQARLREALAVAESEARHSLTALLGAPVAHLARLPHLLTAILHWLPRNSSHYPTCQHALDAFNKILQEGREGSRRMEKMEEMLVLSRQLEFKECKAIPLISASRWLLKKGELTRIEPPASRRAFSRSTSRLYLFLFNDLLIIAKRKNSEEIYSVLDYCPKSRLEVAAATSLEIPSPLQSKEVLKVTLHSNHEERPLQLYLRCPLESDRLRWMSALAWNTLPNCPSGDAQSSPEAGIKVCCVQGYAGQQHDELSLEPGEKVILLRSTFDGWGEGERDGQRGWFPLKNIRPLKSDREDLWCR